jgi:glutamyl-tRNA synthetase
LGDQTFKDVTFLHHKLLRGPNKEKLSKSEGSSSVQFLRKAGKKPSDVYRILGELSGSKEPIVDFESFRNNMSFT